MILSNVNIGTGPSSGDGDPLRSAFSAINNNFQIITNNVNALTNSVTTVAGRTGNVILTVNDIVGLTTNYAVNGNVTAANLGMRGYVDATVAANIALLVNAAPSTLDTIRELADAIGDDPNFAVNVALSVSSANTKMRGYVDGQITAANTASATANVGMTGYVNQANTTMKSYVDGQIAAANTAGGYSNVNTLAYLTTNSYATQTYVNLANTSLKNYVDGQITAANAGVISANLGMKGYVDSVAGGSYSNVQVATYLPTYTGSIGANISKAGKTWTFDSYGNITLPGGVTLGVTTTNTAILTAATSNVVDIQSNNRYNKLQVDDTMVSIITGDSHWHYDLYGVLTTPSGANITSYGAGVTTILDDNGVAIAQQVGVNAFSVTSATGVRAIASGNIWQFGNDGNLTVPGSIIPNANVTYDLGSPTQRWKDLWLSGSTIHIGNANISVSNGSIQSSAPIRADITGNVTASNITVSGNTISIGGATLDVSTGTLESSLPIATTNLTINGPRLDFVQGAFVEESEIAGNPGHYGLALNSPDDGIVGLNALDSNADVTSSVIVSNVLVQLNVANITPGGNALVWLFDQSGSITFPDNTIQTTAFTGGSTYSNVQVATYLPTYTGNVAAGNVKVSTAYRFETGNVTITNESGYVSLNPDTTYSGTAGVKIGGSGFMLGPNGARNITLNYGSVSGAVGLQGNVTIGSAGSGNLFVLGNVIARDITGGNISATGTSGKLGYNSGGFVQQATSNATQVTSHTTSGNIQLMSIDLGAHAVHTVAFSCNKLTTDDIILLQHINGGITSVYVDAYVSTAGLAVIWLRDITGAGTGAFTPMLKYSIIKAPSA